MNTFANKKLARSELRYQVKEIEDYLENKYGKSKVEKAKILLSHPLFDIMVKQGPAVSFETYLKRYFSMVFIVGTTATVEYETKDGRKKEVFQDDPFCSGIAYQIANARERLCQLALLKDLAKALPSVSVGRYFDQHVDNTISHYWENFDWLGFVKVLKECVKAGTDIGNKILGYVNSIEVLREKHEEEFLQIDEFQKLLFWLRVYENSEGIHKQLTASDCESLNLPTFNRLEVNLALVKERDIKIEGRYRQGVEEDLEDFAEAAEKFCIFEIDETGKKFVAYLVSSAFDIFTLVDSKTIPNYFATSVPILKNWEKSPEPKITIASSSGSTKSALNLTTATPPIDCESSVRYLQENFGRDVNAEPHILNGSNPAAEQLRAKMSKRLKSELLSVIPVDFDGQIEEAINLIVAKLKRACPNEEDSTYLSSAVGAIIRAKGAFEVFGRTLKRR